MIRTTPGRVGIIVDYCLAEDVKEKIKDMKKELSNTPVFSEGDINKIIDKHMGKDLI